MTPVVEKMRDKIAQELVGVKYENLMRNKSEWNDLRGEKAGVYLDVNYPFQPEVNALAKDLASVLIADMRGFAKGYVEERPVDFIDAYTKERIGE